MVGVGMPKNSYRETVHADGLPPPSSTPAPELEPQPSEESDPPLLVKTLDEAKARQTGKK